MEDFSKNLNYRQLAQSLHGAKIENAVVVEKGSVCTLNLKLDDGRLIEIGVTGNLHDEAYFYFRRA